MSAEETGDIPDYVRLLREITDEAAPYTEEARARAAFAVMAQEVAETAIRLVRVNDTTDAGLVAEVDALVRTSQQLLTRAVVAARANPTQSWEKIGAALGVTRQSAQTRFGPACDAWTAAFNEQGGVLPDGAADTADAAAALDVWLLQHLDSTAYRAHPEQPVSGGLARMDPHEETGDITRRERLLWQQHLQPPYDQLAALADREAVLLDKMAEIGLGTNSRQEAVKHRALAAGYRAQAATAAVGPVADRAPTDGAAPPAGTPEHADR